MSACLTVFVSMVHCRTPLGAWKHAQRSYKRGFAPRPPVFYGDVILPPPAPPVLHGVEFSGIRSRSSWNDLCDKSEDLDMICPTLDLLETYCPAGVVTSFVDAPIIAKEFSRPTVLCLAELLASESVAAKDISRPTVLCLTELLATESAPVAETVALLDHEAISKRLSELEELNERLENLHKEFKTDMAKDLAGIGDRITAALFEKFSVNDDQGNEQDFKPPLEPHQLSFADRRQMFSPKVALDGAISIQTLPSPTTAEPSHCKENEDMLHKGAAHRETSATDSDYFVLVFSEQYKMKRYCFKRSQFNRQEVLYSNQLSMKRYIFKNSEVCRNKMHEQVLSELMNDECMNPTLEEAVMLNWLNPNARFPIAQNAFARSSVDFSFSGDSDGFSFLPNALSQNGKGPFASG
mgnify:CR=1 FL=1